MSAGAFSPPGRSAGGRASAVPTAMACGAVLLMALAAYAGNWGHGFVFDDGDLVARNERIRSLDTVLKCFTTPYWGEQHNDGLYRPVTLVS